MLSELVAVKKTKARLIGTRMVWVDQSLLTQEGGTKPHLQKCWQRRLWKLQQRIYRASKRGDIKVVRKLQKMLMRSASARYLASDSCDGGSLAIKQCLMQWALEPEWRACFELDDVAGSSPSSVGELLQAIAKNLENGPKFVWVIDLATLCQPRILTQKLATLPGYFELNKAPIDEDLGSLLDAIAIRELSQLIRELGNQKTTLIRYEQIMVILDKDQTAIEACQNAVFQWLNKLEIPQISDFYSITNTAKFVKEKSPGFNIGGFHIRQFVTNHHHGCPYQTTITPSRQCTHQHYQELAAIVNSHKASSQGDLINLLNHKIYSWSSQYQWANNRKNHRYLDGLIYQKLRAWAKRRHPHKPINYWRRKYWQVTEADSSEFGCFHRGKWVTLLKHRV